jgi:hypothetical protein
VSGVLPVGRWLMFNTREATVGDRKWTSPGTELKFSGFLSHPFLLSARRERALASQTRVIPNAAVVRE